MTEFEPEVHACSLVMIAIQELLCEKTLDVMGRIIDKAEINEQNKKEVEAIASRVCFEISKLLTNVGSKPLRDEKMKEGFVSTE